MKKLMLRGLMLFGGIGYIISVNAQCLTQWQYATPIDITNQTSGDLHNFQVKLTINTAALVSANKLQASGNDLRFYAGNCCNLLSFFVDSNMNSTNTKVWVKVPFIPASGTTTIRMAYGNPAAAAASDPVTTFDLWEPFDNSVNHFTIDACGSGTYSVSGGIASLSWGGNMIIKSDVTFDMDTVYTAETNVTGSSGNWPGMHWLNEINNNRGYGILYGGGQVRNSKTGASTGFCQGHNWASGLFNYSTSVGMWSTTWIASGLQESYVPGLYIQSTDGEHPKDDNLKLCMGGISSGAGSMDMDWVRVRKYTSTTPTASMGSEVSLSFLTVDAGNDTSFCAGSSVQLTANNGFTSYSWNTTETTPSINVNSGGTYIITAIDAAFCPSTDTVIVVENSLPLVNLGADYSVCANDSTTLNAGPGFQSYTWSNGLFSQTISIPPGTYMVTVDDANGCSNADTITVGSYLAPTAGFTNAPAGLSVNFTNTSVGGAGATYHWDFGDGDTSTTASPTHVYNTSGTYLVCLTVTTVDGCESTMCGSISVTNTGVENTLAFAGIEMYPNPATDMVWVKLPQSLTGAEITLIDLLGKTIFINKGGNGELVTLSTTNISKGVYTLNVRLNDTVYSGKLILN